MQTHEPKIESYFTPQPTVAYDLLLFSGVHRVTATPITPLVNRRATVQQVMLSSESNTIRFAEYAAFVMN